MQENSDFGLANLPFYFAKSPPLLSVNFSKPPMVNLPFLQKTKIFGEKLKGVPWNPQILKSQPLKINTIALSQSPQTTVFQSIRHHKQCDAALPSNNYKKSAENAIFALHLDTNATLPLQIITIDGLYNGTIEALFSIILLKTKFSFSLFSYIGVSDERVITLVTEYPSITNPRSSLHPIPPYHFLQPIY